MTPKLIHYCWFGGNPLPESAQKFIASWKKFLPDYEVIEWNESNFDVRCCNYVKEAYESKKWAFVSDYARFKILYEYGGLYFDTDVEIIKPLDKIIDNGPFLGEEGNGKQIKDNQPLNLFVAPGLGMLANPKMDIYKEVLNYYESISFDTDNLMTVCAHVTSIMRKYGFRGDGSIEKVKDIFVYPPRFFSPKDTVTGKLTITEDTHTIHHYDATWLTPKERYAQKKAVLFRKFMPKSTAGLVAEFFAVAKYEGLFKAIKKVFSRGKK